MTKKDIVNILMNRDGLTEKEAEYIINETVDMINEQLDAGKSYLVEDIMQTMLGLEMDYVFALI